MLQQVESLLYLDEHNLFEPGVQVEEMTRISFLRQQDIRVLCDKVKAMTEQMKKKQELMDSAKIKMDGEKQSRTLIMHMNERMGSVAKGKECIKGGVDGGCKTADKFISWNV